jgi:hypothetical protein
VNGRITFNYQVCDASYNTASVFQFYFGNKAFVCETDSIDFSNCACACPSEEDRENWFEITTTQGEPGSSCGVDQCSVTGRINVPSYYNCFTKYSISPYPYKFDIQPGGAIAQYNTGTLACLDKGEYRLDTLKLYRSLNDPIPCIIIKPAFCPFELAPKGCTPDCETVLWNYDTLDIPLSCPDCKVIAYYQWRTNTCYTPNKQDIQITYFATYNSGNDTTACDNCNLSVDEIHKLVLKKAIYDNKMGFLPNTSSDTGDCNETWRVIMASCWIEYYTYFSGLSQGFRLARRPCDSTECCSIGLRVCRYDMGTGNPNRITIDTLGGSGGGDSCIYYSQIITSSIGFGIPVYHPNDSVSYYNLDTLQCQDRCNWLYGLTDTAGYFGKKAIKYDIESKKYHGTNESNLKVKFYDDHLDFNIESDMASDDLIISVSSLHGFNLLSNKFRLKKGENQYQIQTQNLVTGIYFICVQLNGLILKTEKFIIIR